MLIIIALKGLQVLQSNDYVKKKFVFSSVSRIVQNVIAELQQVIKNAIAYLAQSIRNGPRSVT